MWSKTIENMFNLCEGYRLIDVVHINGKEIVIGKNGNFSKPFATFERNNTDAPFVKARYFKYQREAVADLCKRAEREIQIEKQEEQSQKKSKEFER